MVLEFAANSKIYVVSDLQKKKIFNIEEFLSSNYYLIPLTKELLIQC